jgi:hypothetical protein
MHARRLFATARRVSLAPDMGVKRPLPAKVPTAFIAAMRIYALKLIPRRVARRGGEM